MRDEVANDIGNCVPQEFPIDQYTLDRLRDPAQTFGSAPVLGREIANICSCRGIARFQLLKDHILLGMMVGIGIALEIGNDCPDDLVVRPLSAIKDAQLLLKNEKQLFDIAMFLAQKSVIIDLILRGSPHIERTTGQRPALR